MERRDFLRATVASAGALALGVSCDSNPNDPPADDTPSNEPLSLSEAESSAFFPQSVASGDPRANSVILWTRIHDGAHSGDDLDVMLEVALDSDFQEPIALDDNASFGALAEASFDHCVKIRVEGLDPNTTYYYRFIYDTAAGLAVSRTGRTKTAPAPGSDQPVKFAVVSCQDYIGRYYNTLRRLATEEVDFIVHLGDYVYETSGDSSFQDSTEDRSVRFEDIEGAIVFNEGSSGEFFAAKSLSNYRQLYKTYRSDADLQQIHERFPVMAIWDDHEFSDDSHGATGTYRDGQENEEDVGRRKNANKAWFEFMPVDYLNDPDFRYDENVDFPGDLNIYRDIIYGDHVHVVLTDLRTHRTDHLIPEDAFPGAIAATEEDLLGSFDALPDAATPYVDIAQFKDGIYADALLDAGTDPEDVSGHISVAYINDLLAEMDTPMDAITEEEQATLPRGIAWTQMGKRAKYDSVGSRYFVIEDIFQIYARVLWDQTNGESESILGTEQREWFLNTMASSEATWKIWGTEYCLVPRIADLTTIGTLPPSFRQRFTLSAEDWAGSPNRRDAMIDTLSALENVVAVTGDIHAFFAGTPGVSTDLSRRIPEFVTGAISSSSYKTLLLRAAQNDPVLLEAGAPALAYGAEIFLLDEETKPNPHLAHLDLTSHGYMLFEADSSALHVSFHAIPEDHAKEHLGAPESFADLFTVTRFKVDSGSPDIYLDVDGTWKRWDITEAGWV